MPTRGWIRNCAAVRRSRCLGKARWDSCDQFRTSACFPQHCSVAEAWQQVQAWLAQPNVSVPTPTPQHARIVGELVASGKLSTKDVPDIHLAALAISHGPKLASHNRGSARFDGLRWIDPIGA